MKYLMRFIGILLLAGFGHAAWGIPCAQCGLEARNDARFCDQCGRPLPGPAAGAPAGASAQPSPGSAGSPVVQAFQVTSQYLLVSGYRLARHSLFWIAEVSGDRARIWSVDQPSGIGLIMGWVSIAELEKRSTLHPGVVISCVEPPPPTEAIVVIHRRATWRDQRYRPFGVFRSRRDHPGDRRGSRP
jgi:hypothetical protein